VIVRIFPVFLAALAAGCATVDRHPDAAAGTVAGAAAGAVIGRAIGAHNGSAARGTAAGAAVGAVVGGLAGSLSDARRDAWAPRTVPVHEVFAPAPAVGRRVVVVEEPLPEIPRTRTVTRVVRETTVVRRVPVVVERPRTVVIVRDRSWCDD
jgi:hypothetical protein